MNKSWKRINSPSSLICDLPLIRQKRVCSKSAETEIFLFFMFLRSLSCSLLLHVQTSGHVNLTCVLFEPSHRFPHCFYSGQSHQMLLKSNVWLRASLWCRAVRRTFAFILNMLNCVKLVKSTYLISSFDVMSSVRMNFTQLWHEHDVQFDLWDSLTS